MWFRTREDLHRVVQHFFLYDAKVNNAVSSLGEIYNVVGAHRGSINHK